MAALLAFHDLLLFFVLFVVTRSFNHCPGGVIRTLFRFVLGMAEGEAANLEIPQDRLLRLEGESLEWL